MGAWRGAYTRLEQRLCLPIRPLLRQPVLRLGHRRTPASARSGASRASSATTTARHDERFPVLVPAAFGPLGTALARARTGALARGGSLPSACCSSGGHTAGLVCARDARRGPCDGLQPRDTAGSAWAIVCPSPTLSGHARPGEVAMGTCVARPGGWGGPRHCAPQQPQSSLHSTAARSRCPKLDERHARTVGLASAW